MYLALTNVGWPWFCAEKCVEVRELSLDPQLDEVIRRLKRDFSFIVRLRRDEECGGCAVTAHPSFSRKS